MRNRPPSRPDAKNYEVGKGRPPKHTRWRPGQSGNPKGRPKGTKGFVKILNEELEQTYQIEEGGKLRKITKRRLIAKQLINRAMKGDTRAMAYVMGVEPEFEPQVEPTKLDDDMSPQEVYQRMIRRIG
jgi:Family of unknown function (DUF5681)